MPDLDQPNEASRGATDYDVAVLGSGLAGSIIAACLARNGAKVVVLDTGSHPRFEIGESTTPYVGMLFRLISERYDVPEVKYLATFERALAKITPTIGVKHNIGFVYHRPDQPQNPREATMFHIPSVAPTQLHFFRQDIDAWMATVAARYGANVLQSQKLTDVRIDESGVSIHRANREPVRAKFVVDTMPGSRSLLSDKLGIGEPGSRFRHRTRMIYSHLLGVVPYDDIATREVYHHPNPWHTGTLHHVFHGGWMWVIPFGNHGRGTNPLCSVGLNLDPRVHPPRDCPPEQEFTEFIAQFPDLKRQLAGARPAQEWTRIDQVQHSCTRTVGYRWCVTSHAAGYLDPMYNGGLAIGLQATHALVHRLLAAIADDDFAVERFHPVERLEQGLLDFDDDVYANTYAGTVHYPLWNALYQIWTAGQVMSVYEINRCYTKYLATGDTAELDVLEHPWWSGTGSSGDPAYQPVQELYRYVTNRVLTVERDGADPDAAAADLIDRLRRSHFAPPIFGLGRLDRQWTNMAPYKVPQTLSWARKTASPEIGKLTTEGLLLFMKVAFKKSEFDAVEVLRNLAVDLPVIGRHYQIPAPK